MGCGVLGSRRGGSRRGARHGRPRAFTQSESATGWMWSGFLRLFAGSTATAIEHFETSLRLDPHTPLRPFHHTGLGAAIFSSAASMRRRRCWPGRSGRFRPMSRQPGCLRLITPIWSDSTMREGSSTICAPQARQLCHRVKFFSANRRNASSSSRVFGARRARRFDGDQRLTTILASRVNGRYPP
jgi:hypothetical protein